MSENSESRPHVVYDDSGEGWVYPNYREAHVAWDCWHTWQHPYKIVTLGRECTPAAALTDPAE